MKVMEEDWKNNSIFFFQKRAKDYSLIDWEDYLNLGIYIPKGRVGRLYSAYDPALDKHDTMGP